ncbi:ComF family protein [Antribacter sp. KLBMP9083]|uniref:ComF family protein n=1 Tax=Antribacter soli TaxID=2910976 RepID=A0AA41U5M0_9MICO|nr:phosphoribosyltransferase family protein [Antribacter soli]MCF4120163.1 ComF family protein [Antribacter soli]
MNALRELSRLLLPVACPCGLPDVPWCAACAAVLAGPPVRVEDAAPRLDRLDGVAPLPVWAQARYAGPVRDVVVHWKDRGRADLDGLLGRAIRRTAAASAAALPGGRLLVVPVPSSGAARRSRGREPVRVLAREVAAGLRSAGADARPVALLHRPGRARDQVGLGTRARGRNLAAAVRVTRRGRGLLDPASRAVRGGVPGRPGAPGRASGAPVQCLLVDDVLTTGATLAAAERVLEQAGAAVLGAIVLAATPPPGRASREGRTR